MTDPTPPVTITLAGDSFFQPEQVAKLIDTINAAHDDAKPDRVECRCGATVAAWALAERNGICPCCGNRVEAP